MSYSKMTEHSPFIYLVQKKLVLKLMNFRKSSLFIDKSPVQKAKKTDSTFWKRRVGCDVKTVYGPHLAALGKPRCVFNAASELSKDFEFLNIQLDTRGDS